MASEDRHITRINDTEANLYANLDLCQSGIMSDGNEDWVYKNDDNTRMYFGANQKYRDGGGYHYCDVAFNDVTAYGDLTIARYLYHDGDTDTFLDFHDDEDRVRLAVGGSVVWDTESTEFLLFPSARAQPTIWGAAYRTLTLYDSSSISDSGSALEIVRNAYYDDTHTRWEQYADLTDCTRYAQTGYDHVFYGAANTTSGNIVPWVEGLRISCPVTSAGSVIVNDAGYAIDFRWESEDNANGLFCQASADSGEGYIGMGTGTPDRALHVERETAATNSVLRLLRLTHMSSGTTGNGFGAGMEFEVEDQYGTARVSGAIDAVARNYSPSNVTADLVFSAMYSTTLAEVARFTSDGALWLSYTGISWTANQEAAFGITDDNYAKLVSSSLTTGGLQIQGFSGAAAADSCAISLLGRVENDPSDEAAVHILTQKHDGAGALAAIGAAGKVFGIENHTTHLFDMVGTGASTFASTVQSAGLSIGRALSAGYLLDLYNPISTEFVSAYWESNGCSMEMGLGGTGVGGAWADCAFINANNNSAGFRLNTIGAIYLGTTGGAARVTVGATGTLLLAGVDADGTAWDAAGSGGWRIVLADNNGNLVLSTIDQTSKDIPDLTV